MKLLTTHSAKLKKSDGKGLFPGNRKTHRRVSLFWSRNLFKAITAVILLTVFNISIFAEGSGNWTGTQSGNETGYLFNYLNKKLNNKSSALSYRSDSIFKTI